MIALEIAFGLLLVAAVLFWTYAISYHVWLLIKPLAFGDWTDGWRVQHRSDEMDHNIKADLAKIDAAISKKDLGKMAGQIQRKQTIKLMAQEFKVMRSFAEVRLIDLGLIDTN